MQAELSVPDIENDTPEQNEKPYALVKLAETKRSLKNSTVELPLLRKRIENKKGTRQELKQGFSKLLHQLKQLVLILHELEENDLASVTNRFIVSLNNFNQLTPDYTKLVGVLTNFHENLPETNALSDLNLSRSMNIVKMGYFPTCPDNMAYIKNGVKFPETQTNILDPCCGCGAALSTLAGENTLTYGVELDDYRASQSQPLLTRTAFGSFFHSRISKESFHCLYLNPPYLSMIQEGGNNTRLEKRFLTESIPYIAAGGLLIYVIPFHRLTSDIARVLSDNFNDITIWKFVGKEFDKFKQIAIYGIKKKRSDNLDEMKRLTDLATMPEGMSVLTELPKDRYCLPEQKIEVKLFKGSKFNVAELQTQLSNSKSFKQLFQRSKLDNLKKQPLLPLSLSQIGLIGGSGLINGLIDCATPHVIKGRIVKNTSQSKEENINSRGQVYSTTITEIKSNKMIFNILTQEGMISLTNLTASNESDYDDFNETIQFPDIPVFETETIKSKFDLGRTVITANARSQLTNEQINGFLKRHATGDWGELGDEDRRTNEEALKDDLRLMSSYQTEDGTKVWVITEADRSYTTVLFPSDY